MKFTIARLLGSVFVSAIVASAVWAQTPDPSFDPLHPFAHVTSAADYRNKFRTGKPNMTPNDPYNNVSGGDIGRYLMGGGNFDHPGRAITDLKGTGGRGSNIRSPYPFKSAQEHYDAWLKAANGGTKMTRAMLPDWSGDWIIGGESAGGMKLSEELASVSDAYKPKFVRNLRAEWLEHGWGASQWCLPSGFLGFWSSDTSTFHFMSDQKMVEIGKDRFNEETRWIYTDGRGFLPPDLAFPQWYGASIGFWDHDALVVLTKQVKGWKEGNIEFTDNLEAVERIQRIGDNILVDQTVYDPVAFAYPRHNAIFFRINKDWKRSPTTYQECVSTNNVHMTKTGEYDEYALGDLEYKDPSDAHPWESAYKRWDDAHPNVPQWTVPQQ